MCSKVCGIGDNPDCPGARTAVIEVLNASDSLKIYFISPNGTIAFSVNEKSIKREFETTDSADYFEV